MRGLGCDNMMCPDRIQIIFNEHGHPITSCEGCPLVVKCCELASKAWGDKR